MKTEVFGSKLLIEKVIKTVSKSQEYQLDHSNFSTTQINMQNTLTFITPCLTKLQ